jgi:hypothetical protein
MQGVADVSGNPEEGSSYQSSGSAVAISDPSTFDFAPVSIDPLSSLAGFDPKKRRSWVTPRAPMLDTQITV